MIGEFKFAAEFHVVSKPHDWSVQSHQFIESLMYDVFLEYLRFSLVFFFLHIIDINAYGSIIISPLVGKGLL